MALQHLRSSTTDKRPTPTSMADGQVAINTAAVSPGVFFKDAGGSLVKVGPVHVGTTAPNVSPAVGGHAGNSVGEQWLDTTGGTYVFKVWDGSAWRSETGTFVDVNGDVMTGALGIIAGTAGAPGLYISGDTNTGIYSPGADQLAISTAGTGRLFVDASGNVGVGTSPSTLLHIAQSGSVYFRVQRTTSGSEGTVYLGCTSSANQIISTGATDSTAKDLRFDIGATERMRLDSSGRLGLGTSSPAGRLHVASGDSLFGDGNLTRILGPSQVIDFTNAAQNTYVAGRINGLNLKFYTNAGSGIDIDSTGRVGIGTTSPGATLHVAGECVLGDNGTNGRLTVNTTTSTVGLFATTTGFGAYEDLELRGAVTIFKRDGTNESARIDSSGRLLVGTSTARSNLQGASRTARIQLEAASSAVITAADGATISALGGSTDAGVCAKLSLGRYASNTLGDTTLVSSDDFLGVVSFVGADGTNFIPGASIVARVDGTPGANDMPGRLVFSTTADGAATPTERLRITSAGRVGIGTTSPVSLLHVSAATGITYATVGNGNGGTQIGVDSAGLSVLSAFANNAIRFGNSSGSTFSETMRLDASGRLLVGTSTSPSNGSGQFSAIVAQGYIGAATGDGSISIQRGEAAASITSGEVIGGIYFNESTGYTFANIKAEADANAGAGDYPGRLVFSTTADGAATPTERMRISSNGTVRFNTATGGENASVVISNNVASTYGLSIYDLANSGWIARFFDNSSVIAGSITRSGSSVAYNTSSDYRLKENLVPLTGAVDRVNQLQVHRFNFIANPDKTVDGFIAHEAQAIVPECVTGEKDAVDDDGNPVYQGIDQSKLVPLLTAALQEALQKIQDLEGRLTAAGI